MQDSAEPAEASIPTGNGRIVRRMTGIMRRKVAKRTMPIPSPPSQQHSVSPTPTPTLLDEDVAAAKRPRLEALISTYSDSVSDSDTRSIQIASQRTTDTVPSEVTFTSSTLSMTAAASHQESPTTTYTASNTNNLIPTPPPAQKGSFTLEEDDKLARAVKELGCKDWVAVAALVPGRTSSQCRKRWACFLDLANKVAIKRLAAEREAKPRADLPQKDLPVGRWTAQEDAKLRAAVQKYGDKKWVKVASEVPGRTRVTCRKRWVFYLGAADRTTGRWTAEEDAKLASALIAFGSPKKNWIAISAVVQSRTPTQCYERLVLLSDTGDRRKGKWTLLEDANLTTAVMTHGRDWEAVGPLVPGRTNDQCRKRWAQKTGEFTAE